MTPDEYCQDKASSSGSSFYYSFLFLPNEKRKAITALYAFCREVDDVVDETHDPDVARIKLQWWREEISHAFEGVPQHPVAKALKPVVANFNLPLEFFLEIIDGMQMDLENSHYQTFQELSLYCYRVASVVGLMTVEIFGFEDRKTLKYAHDLGMAFQLTNILRDVREDAARGRIYLPADEMERFGVTIEDLRKANLNDGIRELLAFQAQRARDYYHKAFEQLPEQDRYNQRSGLIMARVYLTLLDTIEKQNYPVLERRVKLSPFRKLWLAWRTARRELKRHNRYQKKLGQKE